VDTREQDRVTSGEPDGTAPASLSDDVGDVPVTARPGPADMPDIIREAVGVDPGTGQVPGIGEGEDPEEYIEALDWFLSEDPRDAGVGMEDVKINIGTSTRPRYTSWTICTVDAEALNHIRQPPQRSRASRRAEAAGEMPQQEASLVNAKIVLAGTLKPDMREAARRRGLLTGQEVDPSKACLELLRWRFRNKPGLVDQLAGEILALSGYDEEDVKLVKRGASAAGAIGARVQNEARAARD
jgi:hypothetical protein